MKYDNAVVATWFAANGVIDKLELWAELDGEEAAFLADYQTKLAASTNTNSEEDMRFKMIFDRWYLANMAGA